MKTSGISPEFRERYLSNPKDPEAFEGNAMVFDGPEDYHARIDDPAQGIDEHTILFMRGAGPVGYPGGAEVVNMQPPAYLIKKGIHALACIGDGRQSGTSGSPSILNASPEAAIGGGLALLKTGDRVRIDSRKAPPTSWSPTTRSTRRRAELQNDGGYHYPKHQTPWQEIQRGMVDQFSRGHGAEAGGEIPGRRPHQRRAEGQSLSAEALTAKRQRRLDSDQAAVGACSPLQIAGDRRRLHPAGRACRPHR